MHYSLLAWLFLLICSPALAGVLAYPSEGYSIEIPQYWGEKALQSPSGTPMRAFMDERKNAAGYCHVEGLDIDKRRTPALASLNEQSRRTFLLKKWTLEDWLQMYPNLASAQNFRFIHTFPGELGEQTLAAVVDFGYSVPNGYFYRVRTHLTITKRRALSLWCMAIGRSQIDADRNFGRYLEEFQFVAARLRPVEK